MRAGRVLISVGKWPAAGNWSGISSSRDIASGLVSDVQPLTAHLISLCSLKSWTPNQHVIKGNILITRNHKITSNKIIPGFPFILDTRTLWFYLFRKIAPLIFSDLRWYNIWCSKSERTCFNFFFILADFLFWKTQSFHLRCVQKANILIESTNK